MNPSRHLSLLFITLACVLLYAPTLRYDFAYDDYYQIVRNKVVTAPASSLTESFTTATFPGDLYRPVTVFSYRLQYLLNGLTPSWYHGLNLLLHLFCSLAVFFLAKHFITRNIYTLLAALWFALHPIHIEAVANIVGRAELLTAFFGVLCTLFFIHARRFQRTLPYLLSLICFQLAVLSKESGLTLLGVITVISFHFSEKRSLFQTTKALLPFFLLATASLFLRWHILGELAVQERDLTTYYVENPLLQESFINRLLPGIKILGDYARLLTLPIHMSADYSLPKEIYYNSLTSPDGLFSFAVGFFVLIIAFFRHIHAPMLWWFLLTFSLTLNILTPIGTIMGERLAYLPSVGFCIFCFVQLERWSKKNVLSPQVHYTTILAFLCLTAAIAYHRLPVWKNNETLFLATTRDNPSSPKAHLNYGMYLYHQKKDYALAEQHFRQALTLDNTRIEYYKNMINALLAQNKFANALYWVQKGLEQDPGNQDLLHLYQRLTSPS